MKKFEIPGYMLALIMLFIVVNSSSSQDWQLVWSDEFEGSSVNVDNWNFELGTSNDNIQYYTDRSDNCQIVDGKLCIIVKRENYLGMEYTSSLINTVNKVNWRYGKIEARIKVATTPGLVNAFWMMPIDAIYGFWPNSGEIDIMEHPTHEPQNIYGTIHTGDYNWFDGEGGPPKGGVIAVPDLETNYHVYAIEWTPDSIHHLLDDQRYHSFGNDYIDSDTWPFDQAFYIILNVSVGGGWCGNPAPEDPFPATMLVDYVRLYQNLDDILITGPDFLAYNAEDERYCIPMPSGADIEWSVPEGASIQSGQNTNAIILDWGNTEGSVIAYIEDVPNNVTTEYPVVLSYNVLKNGNFEKGAKYWATGVGGSVDAEILLDRETVPLNNYIRADINTLGSFPWDVQLSQRFLQLESGEEYVASFRAKAENGGITLNAAVINSQNYQVYGSSAPELANDWSTYEFEFTMPEPAIGSFNFDLADDIGTFSIDDVFLVKISDITANGEVGNELEYFTEIIYPNPGKDVILLENISGEPIEFIAVYDQTGRLMRYYNIDNNQNINELNISMLGKGIYALYFKRKNGYSMKRVIIL